MFENKKRQPVPEVTFRTRRGDEWVNLESKDIFNRRNVIVFSLPGAFTPTCSSSQPEVPHDFPTANGQALIASYNNGAALVAVSSFSALEFLQRFRAASSEGFKQIN